MSLIYAELRNENETPDSDTVTEDIPPGDLVTITSSGVELADAGDHNYVGGIALHFEAGDFIADHPFDYSADYDDFVYQPASNKDSEDFLPDTDDRAPVGGQHDGAAVYPRTIAETTSNVTSAPSIGYRDVVGVVDTSDADAPSDAGAIVQEGYSNDENDDSTSTTFNRSNNNFLPLGRAVAVPGEATFPITSFDQQLDIKVVRDKSL